MGRLAHWSHPGGGTSSSRISTAIARELPARAGSCRASVAADSCCSTAVAASSCVSAAAGAGRLSTADAAGNATTTGAAGYASTTTTAIACCTSTTTGARRSSATAGCGPAGETTGRGVEASAAPCELSLAAAASLSPARGALDECHRVGMDASALSTLAGAR
jgi:hypothetical protein